MAIQETRWARPSVQAGVAALFGIILAGCEGNQPELDVTKTAAPVSEVTTNVSPVPVDSKLDQPFADATRAEPPDNGQRPPDLTLTGKSVGKLYMEVVRLWDTIRFRTKEGKPVQYTAVLETDL